MADTTNTTSHPTRGAFSFSNTKAPRGRRPRAGGDHYEASTRGSSRAPRGSARAAPGGHGVRSGRIEKSRGRGRGCGRAHAPRTPRTPRDSTNSPTSSGSGAGRGTATGGPTSSPASQLQLQAIETKLQEVIRRVKRDMEVHAEEPVYFCRPMDKLWGFLSPVNNEGVFEVNGWQYNTIEMYLNACKAKAVGRDDLWKRVLQSGIVGGLKPTNGGESDVVRGFEVKRDGERDPGEAEWADGKDFRVR
jgi:hypothetical protein